MVVKNCYISDMKKTPGLASHWRLELAQPFSTFNNYLEAAGENILFAGAVPYIKDVPPVGYV